MGRWEPDARGRLQEAALDLYVEHGFEHTTVAEIAERAGLTERTFFRHFADKREVLFAGSELLLDLLAHEVAAAPPATAPLDAVASALEAAGTMIQQRREWATRRQAVIAANPELRERELSKLAAMASVLAEGLRRRGVKDPDASLIAEVGVAALRVAFDEWLRRPGSRHLPRQIRASIGRIRDLAVGA